jgi:multidrug efflux pump subunit AcrB
VRSVAHVENARRRVLTTALCTLFRGLPLGLERAELRTPLVLAVFVALSVSTIVLLVFVPARMSRRPSRAADG